MSDRLERSALLRASFGRVVHEERKRRGALPPVSWTPFRRIRKTLGRSTAKTLALDSTAARPPEGIAAATSDELRARRRALHDLLATCPAKTDDRRDWYHAQLTAARERLAQAHERLADSTAQLATASRRTRPEIEQTIARDRSTIAAWQREATERHQALTSLPSPGSRDSWLTEHGPAVRELATIEHELHRRDSNELRATIAIALTNPDPDIHAHLGEGPQQPEQARAWETAVRALVAYRHHTV
jgi:hypothetical protein